MNEENRRVIRSFRDLVVWQWARRLASQTYAATSGWPSSEQFGLTGQIRRAAVSVAANIAEGWARQQRKTYAQYVGIATASLAEYETLVEIASDIALLSPAQKTQLLSQIHQLRVPLLALRRALKSPPAA